MKLSKKLLATALVLAVCFAAVSAAERIDPTSMTNESSKGLFGTDVDDYLDVNEWSNVQPTKMFGFLSYGTSGTGEINTGFAAPIGKFYLGAFFGGQLHSWKSEVGTRTGAKAGNGSFSASSTTANAAPNKASGSVLFGFNNIGILGNITYMPEAGNSTDHHKTLGGLKMTNNKYTLDVAVKAGFNVAGPKDILFKTSAEVGITSKVNKARVVNKTISPDTYAMSNANEHDLHINGGVYFDFAHNGPVTQAASLSLNTDWTIYPTHVGRAKAAGTTVDTYMYGRWHDAIKLEPSWSITYEPEGSKVALKAKVGVPIAFDTKIGFNYTKTDGKKAYNTARQHTTTIDFTPELKAGLTYAPIAKIRFNVGAQVNIPKFGWTITKTQHRKEDDGKVDPDKGGTVRSYGYHFDTADGKIQLASGFTWFITQNVTFDANWKLTDNLLNYFSHQLNKNDDIWKTINKVLVHEVGFMLSVKL
jgi:hypothetical protein